MKDYTSDHSSQVHRWTVEETVDAIEKIWHDGKHFQK